MDNSHLPLVSVVIGFLNEERFLAETVESVRYQTYPHWELLLVDDGSTDQSTAIAKRYAEESGGQIIYCEHEGHRNRGVTASRNYGVQLAKGELVCILDADDVWLPNKLTEQVALFQEHPGIGMVAEASEYWYSWEDAHKEDSVVLVGAPAGRVYERTELLHLLYPLMPTPAPCPSGLMLTKQAILNAGGFEESFTKRYQLYEDQAFLCKIYLAERVYISASCNNRYRQRIGSCVQSVTEAGLYHETRRYFLDWFVDYLRTKNITDSKLLKLLAKSIMLNKISILYAKGKSSIKKVLHK
ncbi:glycosyltransferase family 2 protein [Hymenobacter norwichensis]|uniref:glycosyltransferase family 2 protein n=1 Tax=Hymenobacter norwichensis TaxID=223903 RepID=UPI0003B50CCD|nr:glycosyltransferase family 2 protein [Hymenobacter norwichensis]